jgi:hypothetical protein
MFASIGAEITLPPGNGPYYFWIYSHTYHFFFSLLCPKKANKSGYEFYIFDSDKTTTKSFKTNQTKGVWLK